jgi:hypothetical protein
MFDDSVVSYFQFEAIKNYLDKGGHILVLLGEGGETRFGTNINFLLEDFGIMVNNGEKLDSENKHLELIKLKI